MDARRSKDSPAAAPVKRCLLLVPRGLDAPLDLLDGFRRRGVTIREVADAPSVMLALAREPFLALVMLEPASIHDSTRLYHAVRKHYPRVVVWQYRGYAEPRLVHYVNGYAEPAAAPAPPPHPRAAASNGRTQSAVLPHAQASSVSPAAPDSRVAPGSQPRRPGEREQEIRDAAVLSEEELAMLLDDSPHDHREGRS